MANSGNQNDLARHMEAIASGQSDGRKMVFDPEAGRLVVLDNQQDPHRISPDAVVIDTPTRDGFFGN